MLQSGSRVYCRVVGRARLLLASEIVATSAESTRPLSTSVSATDGAVVSGRLTDPTSATGSNLMKSCTLSVADGGKGKDEILGALLGISSTTCWGIIGILDATAPDSFAGDDVKL